MSAQNEAIKTAMWRHISIALLVAVAALLLFGCSTPAVKDRVVEVVKPVAVQPIKPEQVPALPSPLPSRPASLSAAADLLLSKWCEAVGYMLKADPLLKVSAGQPPKEVQHYPECEGENR